MRITRSIAFLVFTTLVAVGSQRQVSGASFDAEEYFLWLHPNCGVTKSWILIPDLPARLVGLTVVCEDPEEDFCASDPWWNIDAGWMCAVMCEDQNAIDYSWYGSACEGDCGCEYDPE